MATASDLRLISRNGVGLDNVDLEAAARLGIEVRRTAGANSSGVAELAVCLMLCGLRLVPWHARLLADGGWQRSQGRELSSATVGVVGVGAIGGRVARLVASFGATVLATDVNPPVVEDPPYTLVGLEVLLRRSEVVTLHAPATRSGPLLGPKQISALPSGAVLVNTARWSLVDDDAVLSALESGRLRAYAVDAFANEPPEPSALLRHPNVIATPHLGAFTAESAKRASAACVDMILEHVRRHGLLPA
jgi:phosphoglycerate dehydrogenase-like enzyme